MRTNLLNWCNLVSISKNVVFYTFLVVRILLNISWSNVFGKFVLIVIVASKSITINHARNGHITSHIQNLLCDIELDFLKGNTQNT